MTLSRKIAAALDENTRAYTPPCVVSIHDGPDRINLEITSLDSVGVAFDVLEFVASDRKEWTPQALSDWGETLSKRLTYLMEPLKVLEIDGGGGIVQLRSETPTARGDVRSYYEIRLDRGGTCRVERYTIDPSQGRRRRTPCHLTREVVERLADDLAVGSR
ncbi:hypothetical protein [Planctomyces sp. SH-PL62]|uniref:hypothetical protein n=1 Tax=Planctomyces sp. SH-PL62 TaxID=1636152 RepID=UPI00078C0623|nr:hypothetical protein [Planctomyces sp. SH-PL62]AMV39142.1 hypothetical protein VT85_17015 [Planctomyces sp. SH-PL62]